jgi:CHAT domain-containing protein
VDDKATAALMGLFCRNLWIEKMPPLEALRQAQLFVYHNPALIDTLPASRGPAFDQTIRLPEGGHKKPDSSTTPTRQ